MVWLFEIDSDNNFYFRYEYKNGLFACALTLLLTKSLLPNNRLYEYGKNGLLHLEDEAATVKLGHSVLMATNNRAYYLILVIRKGKTTFSRGFYKL